MILNKNRIINAGIIQDVFIDYTQLSTLQREDPRTYKGVPVFYMYCRQYAACKKLKNYLEDHIIEGIRQGKILLVIDFNEGQYEIVEEIYKNIVRDLKIPPKNILFIGISPEFKPYIKNYSESVGLDPINYETFNKFELTLQDWIRKFPYNTFNPLEKTNHDKTYINLNHVFRTHRAYIMNQLKNRNLLKFGYNSWHAYNEPEEIENFKKLYPHLSMPDTMHLDIGDEEITGHDLYGRQFSRTLVTSSIGTLVDYVNNSILNIVNETQFYGGAREASEKTFKPIAFKQPFILVGQHNGLKLLHDFGYKTFDGIIDERYDSESDHQKRLDMILDEIERICNFSEYEKQLFCSSCLEIVNHNYDVLTSKTNFTIK